MEKKKTNSKILSLLSVLLMTVIAITIVVGVVSAKYVNERHIPGKITIKADLAKEIEVFEHTISGNPDVYELTTEETTQGNTYRLMPGVDVPKDPYVRIKGYTGVNAYVYVELISDADPRYVTFSLSDKWVKLDSITNRKIYYYTGTLQAADLIELEILDGKGLTVNYGLPRKTDAFIKFDAFIAQRTNAVSAADAAAVFNANFTPVETEGTGN